MTTDHLPAWVWDAQYHTLDLKFTVDGKPVHAWIAARPTYCDRGHWQFNVEADLNLDGADSFPRYFMSLEAALDEAEAWLRWRLLKIAHTPLFTLMLPGAHGRTFRLREG